MRRTSEHHAQCSLRDRSPPAPLYAMLARLHFQRKLLLACLDSWWKSAFAEYPPRAGATGSEIKRKHEAGPLCLRGRTGIALVADSIPTQPPHRGSIEIVRGSTTALTIHALCHLSLHGTRFSIFPNTKDGRETEWRPEAISRSGNASAWTSTTSAKITTLVANRPMLIRSRC